MASSTPESKSLRILCYGDSLTEGYSCFGMSMTPYSKTLKSILEAVFLAGADKRKVEIVTDGVSGDRVTNASFNDRMVAQCTFRRALFAQLRVLTCRARE